MCSFIGYIRINEKEIGNYRLRCEVEGKRMENEK